MFGSMVSEIPDRLSGRGSIPCLSSRWSVMIVNNQMEASERTRSAPKYGGYGVSLIEYKCRSPHGAKASKCVRCYKPEFISRLVLCCSHPDISIKTAYADMRSIVTDCFRPFTVRYDILPAIPIINK